MTIFNLINACALDWTVIRIYTDGPDGAPKDLGSYFKFQEIPDALLESEVDSWTVYTYQKDIEISIFI